MNNKKNEEDGGFFSYRKEDQFILITGLKCTWGILFIFLIRHKM